MKSRAEEEADAIIASQSDGEIHERFPGPQTIQEKRKMFREMLTSPLYKRLARHSDNEKIANEFLTYESLKIMMPPLPLMDAHKVMQPFLNQTFDQVGDKEGFQRHITDHFKANPTFVDKDWVENTGLRLAMGSPYQVYSNYIGDVLEITPGDNTIFDFMKAYFVRIADALSATKQYIKLEYIVGEVCRVAQSLPIDQERAKFNFPTTFDRVLLSNIPDYTGGPLFVSLYIMPLLKRDVSHSSVKFNVLLNCSKFKDYTDYAKTYTLLPTLESHKSFLGVSHQLGSVYEEDPRWAPLKLPLSTPLLATQDEVISWLTQIFFFFVLPLPEGSQTSMRIDLPLNLLSFMELIKRLVLMGYPAHWFSTLLATLLTGKITTHARPPPVYKAASKTQMSIKPFLPELEFAVAIYQPLLPFSITSPTLPLLSNFKKYKVTAGIIMHGSMQASCLGLIFSPYPSPTQLAQSLRDILNKDPQCYLISTIEWSSDYYEAVFWFNSTLMDELKKKEWRVSLVRTDNWMVSFKSKLLTKARELENMA
eukprot:TRINITY_DN4070_c0_g6_i1.p1 TRINITY_DN4070_c0_g6~~TRINITY_DN4070_c0_g6_i1.p1  ORF type:complete len:625 (+),score=112.32 TRINITY_DN4070_c0_g6_i1:270-1877(+)